jgi:ectoine hydroxylase-related dioxygenase (phytanoyl-CoA dioxygenase family)
MSAISPVKNEQLKRSRLTNSEISQYHEEGFVLPSGSILPEKDFADLKNYFDLLLRDWVARGGRPEAMNCPHFYAPELMRWLMHPAVLDLVEPLIGPNILLFASHFLCKPPGDGQRVPWHEDSSYWKGQWEPMEVATVWLALDDSDLENGCMQVIPKTHLNGYSEYVPVLNEQAVFSTEIKPGTFDEKTAVPCILKPNHASLHHAKEIHGSAPNKSNRRRCGYTMRYISAESKRTYTSSSFQIYQARGKNIANNILSDPNEINKKWVKQFGVNAPKGH